MTELPGIGATLEQKIVALLETGTIPAAEKLRAKFPPGLVAITRLPGLGPKRARLLHARARHRLAAGASRGGACADGCARCAGSVRSSRPTCSRRSSSASTSGPPKRLLLPDAVELGEALAAGLREHGPADAHVALAGSARRLAETVKDIDLIATTVEPAALTDSLCPPSSRSRAPPRRARRARARVTHSGVRVDLRIGAPPQRRQPPAALHRLRRTQRRAARARGAERPAHLRVRDRGRRAPAQSSLYEDEAEVYERARLRVHPARAARGSRRARCGGARRPRPPGADRARDELRGDLHCHTVASDGRATVEEMARAARELGYEYLAITDHSASHGFGHDVSPDELSAANRACARGERADRGHRAARRQRGQHPSRRIARLRGRAARRARLGDRERAHGLRDGRAGDDGAHDRGDRASARGCDRPPDRPHARAPPPLCARPRRRVRSGGEHAARCSRSTPTPAGATSRS